MRFWYRLCLALGFATPAEAQARINAREFAGWKAYYDLEPFGQDRGDAGSAMVAYTVALCNGAKDAKPSDFLPQFGEAHPAKASGNQILSKAKAFVSRYKVLSKARR